MIPERLIEKANYFRIGAAIMNFCFKDQDIHRLLLLLEGIEEKGGEFSLNDAFAINSTVDEYHRLKVPKKEEDDKV